jgi:hypothetical protein
MNKLTSLLYLSILCVVGCGTPQNNENGDIPEAGFDVLAVLVGYTIL